MLGRTDDRLTQQKIEIENATYSDILQVSKSIPRSEGALGWDFSGIPIPKSRGNSPYNGTLGGLSMV